MSATGQGLRERKNEQTRRAITSAALELASEVGFEHATVAQIAERANVSPRTVHAWFPSKDDIVIGTSARIDDLAAALQAGGDGDTIDIIAAWLETVGAARTEPDELARLRYRVVLANSQLRALQRGRLETVEKLIASAIADETGLSSDALGPRSLAAAIVTMLWAMQERFAYARDDDEADIDIALKMLRAALDGLRGQR